MKTVVINALAAKMGGNQTDVLNIIRYAEGDVALKILVGSFNKKKFEAEASKNPCVELLELPAKLENPAVRSFWELFALPKLLRKLSADVYFSPIDATLTSFPQSCRSVATVRNMLLFDKKELARFPIFSKVRLTLFLRRLLSLKAYKKADKIVFVSNYAREFVSKIQPSVAQKSRVITNGINEQFRKEIHEDFDFSKFGLQRGEFYLYVSILDYYKSQLEIIREWKRLVDQGFKYPLVLTGFMIRESYVKKVKDLIAELSLEDKVVLTGPVPYQELPAYYAGARALVFGSTCECCPNILLEMESSGKPTFCSNYQPMPEFGGKDCYYFDPYQEGELTDLILEAEKNESEMWERGRRLKEHSQQYDWKKIVQSTIDYILE